MRYPTRIMIFIEKNFPQILFCVPKIGMKISEDI